MAKIGKAIRKTAFKTFVKKDTSANLKNLYTGYSLRKSTTTAAAIGLGATGLAVVGGGDISNGVKAVAGGTSKGDMSSLLGFKNLGSNAMPAEQISSAPVFIADAQSSKQDKTLGASGNMVFGMHNLRHG